MNNADISIFVQASGWKYVFISLGYILRSGIAGSYGDCFQLFKELPNCFLQQPQHFIFPPTMYRGSYFSTSSRHLLSSFVLIIAVVVGMKCYLTVVLIYIFLMIDDVKHLFMSLLVICISSLWQLYYGSLKVIMSLICALK